MSKSNSKNNTWRSVKSFLVKRKNRKTPITVTEIANTLEGSVSSTSVKATVSHYINLLKKAGQVVSQGKGFLPTSAISSPLSYKAARKVV